MNPYVSASAIKRLRERKGLTQVQLAQRLAVSDKTVSKWETAKGLPDITLLEPLAQALGVSITELFTGEFVTNRNRSSNMLRSTLYVCPVCGNVIRATGQAVVSCCGVQLPALEAEPEGEGHTLCVQEIEDELYVTVPGHPMTKEHSISFLAYVTTDRFELVKLYPEGEAQGRFALRGHGTHGMLYAFCNRHGLFGRRI